MLYTRDTYISQNTLFAILFLICGVTFPVQYLPSWLQTLAQFIPVTQALFVVRASVLQGADFQALWPAYLQMAALASFYCIVGFSLIKRVEQTALEKIFG